MPTLSRTLWNLLLLAALILGTLAVATGRVGPEQPVALPAARETAAEPAPREGHPAPDFALVDLDGKRVRLAELRGQVVLINVHHP